jgi:hypothetical protein
MKIAQLPLSNNHPPKKNLPKSKKKKKKAKKKTKQKQNQK